MLQQWTRLDDPDSQGLVTKHRTGADPAPPPDQEVMKMQMSIVSWQPGPNRQLHVPQLVRESILNAASVSRYL